MIYELRKEERVSKVVGRLANILGIANDTHFDKVDDGTEARFDMYAENKYYGVTVYMTQAITEGTRKAELEKAVENNNTARIRISGNGVVPLDLSARLNAE